MRVLLTTDFSDNAYNALKYALKLFKGKECLFYLLNTYTYNYDFESNDVGSTGKVSGIIKNNSVQQLEILIEKLIENYATKEHSFELVSTSNTFTDEVKKLVEEEHIDLIVMGTKGATGLKEVLFGSNTIHIIKNSKCPVLAVPDGYFFEAPTNVLFPTDFTIDYSQVHLKVFKTIATLFDSTLHALHASRKRKLDQIKNRNKEKLKTILSGVDLKFHMVDQQEIPMAINEFQNTNYIQLLMMVNNKHTFLENLFFKPVIDQIGFHLSVPFLVLPYKK